MPDLGSSSADEVRAAAIAAYGERPDASATSQEMLSEKVIAVAKQRLKPEKLAEEVAAAGFAVFITTDDFRSDRTRLNAVYTPALDNAAQRLSGSAWIVPPTFTSGAKLPIEENDLGAIFEAIETLGLGDRHAVVIDFSVPDIRIYPHGVESHEDVLRAPIANEKLTDISLCEILQEFAEDFIVTPNALNPSVNPWEDGEKYLPIRNAEKKIQDYLEIVLRGRLSRDYKVETEVTIKSGRVDIVINRRLSETGVDTVATIEMKVARSFSSRNNRPVSHATLSRYTRKGFRQARAYRDELKAPLGYLLIYDLRTWEERAQDLLEPHRDAAKAEKINLRCDNVFGTSEQFRQAGYGD